MKIWHISDTHSYHNLLEVPEADIVIHSGDATNYRDVYKNEVEFQDFLYWYQRLPIKHKIFVAGNHDITLEKNIFDAKKQLEEAGIIYLENDSIEIEGLKIWGSPHTPSFGNWSFMKPRNTINRVWEHIPDDTDIIVTHGPPKGFLDLSEDKRHSLEQCGCNALKKRIMKINPKLVCFGHIHSSEKVINAGILLQDNIVYSNGSVCTDGKFGKLSSMGNMITFNSNKNIDNTINN